MMTARRNEHILTSGSKDGKIHHHDVRAREHIVGELTAHEQEVCGLEWSAHNAEKFYRRAYQNT